MRSSFSLGSIAGIKIGINYTWLLAFALITWSLAVGFFPQTCPSCDTTTSWVLGAAAAILLFASVLVHELAHSIVAQARGMPVKEITLFIFGGVSNISGEARSAGDEFVMAGVGPLTSLIIAGIFGGVWLLIGGGAAPVAALLFYLALINGLLAGFNLLPGFPLDGGRVLRSIIWGATGNMVRATNIAATVGQVFAWGFIAWGVYQLLTGNLLGGIWTAFIGWFLNGAADASRQEVTMREVFRRIRVKDVMTPEPETISPQTTIQDLVEDVFLQRNTRVAPVCEADRPVGIVTLSDVRHVPQRNWPLTPVGDIMTREPLYAVGLEDDLASALQLLSEHDINQVMVMQDGQCVGLLRRSDIIRHMQISQELGLPGR